MIVRYPAVAAGLTAFALGIAGCNGDERAGAGNGATDTTAARSESLEAAWKRRRAKVIAGARRDFDDAVGGPRGFAICFISRFGRRLTQDRVSELAAIHAREGEPAAARALNGLGVPDGDACGGRQWVPQLTEAAAGLRPERRPGARRSSLSRVPESTPVVCAVGERPGYFVPGPANGPLALLGCARLGLSGKRVEFSANVAQIDGTRHPCVNAAYSGRGQRGFYIPAICALEPPLSRFAVRAAAQPRQGVRGYAFVIWGTTGSATDVVARFSGGTARATVFKVPAGLAENLGESPFGLFVMELPLSAACAPVTVTGERADAIEQTPPRPKLCERARDLGPVRPDEDGHAPLR